MMMKSQLAKAQEITRVAGKGKGVEAIEIYLVIKKNEVKVLRVKLDKE